HVFRRIDRQVPSREERERLAALAKDRLVGQWRLGLSVGKPYRDMVLAFGPDGTFPGPLSFWQLNDTGADESHTLPAAGLAGGGGRGRAGGGEGGGGRVWGGREHCHEGLELAEQGPGGDPRAPARPVKRRGGRRRTNG